ncbi:HAL/PAL/TAL family ammonia-lyase [Cognatiluteimonas weifangensis]|uniref:Aromatic amino acid lyase n=1 Tax=Cognatiluteimonas weifangensis TaxID=2303539 RepID=A0A372DML9_9GAMM|nr:aromatic amino acid lyase [Luteimonas weifangensis]RFP60810.1 aromatic amino acid lyase [Luteimonas weifangensis]
MSAAPAETVRLDGKSLTRAQLVAVARGASVELDDGALRDVARAADFLAAQVARGEPIYGVSTGFGSNADKLLAADGPLREQLQRNLIVTHAVCVGEPFAPDVVRAMLCIRINTLLRGHSGIRVSTLQALAAMLNAGVVPVVPQLGSVGASGDLAPLSHLAIVLLGGGEAFFDGERLPGDEALRRAGLAPATLTIKEGLALNNGTAQMLATGVLALAKLEALADTADLAAAMTLEAFAGRSGAFAEPVHALRPHPGQVHVAARLRALLAGSSLIDIDYDLVPRFAPGALGAQRFDLAWRWDGERIHGGKKRQPQDSYSLRCVPQVHGAVRDALAQAARVLEIELNAVTDNPLVFPDAGDGQAVVSAGHFHGMPLALAMSYVKAAIPVLASIAERRLNKLVDPATNDGLPAFLVGNADGTESGFMIVQYTAAAIVNDLASRAMPAAVYSIPTSANAEDHVSMGANEARHVLAMADDLGKVLALELFTAAQALELRLRMLAAARDLAGDADAFAARVQGGPAGDDAACAAFRAGVDALRADLRDAGSFHPGRAVAAAHAAIRTRIAFLDRDRALDGDVRAAMQMLAGGSVLAAARAAD